MKKLITLFISFLFAFSLNAQDIVNQVGASGNFILKDSDGTETFKFTHDILTEPELMIGKNIQSVGADAYMMQIQNSSTVAPAISFANFNTTTRGAGLIFHKADGPTTAVKVDDVIGYIAFSGQHTGGTFTNYGAEITSTATDVNDGAVAGKLEFKTHDGVTGSNPPATRLTILDNGVLNIPNLDMDVNAYVLVDADGNLYSSTSVPTAPNSPKKSEIEQLKSENEMLKNRLEKLEAIVEALAKQ